MTAPHQLDPARARAHVDEVWRDSVVPTLIEYIRIPNKSPLYDARWQEHGHMDRAVALLEQWCLAHALPGMSFEVVRAGDRTPVLFMEVPGDSDDTVLLYGHLDKQPEMSGWSEGLGPWTPVMRGERLYGRGGADDGYSTFASLTALAALAEQKVPRARCVVLIEACEESGSTDLPYYIDALADRIGTPSLVICLDSGCGNYDQLWCTTSLRGLVAANLTVQVLEQGVHSGDASGIVPSSFRILRHLLGRLEDERTGRILLPELHVEVPAGRLAEAKAVAAALGEEVFSKFPLTCRPMADDPAELILNRTWRPTLSVTGVAGMPPMESAGNVLRPFTTVKLSIRLPPTGAADPAIAAVKRALESDPPYGAKVTVGDVEAAAGWNAPAVAPWLAASLESASQAYFGKPAVAMGEGGSIPFMGMLGARFPQAQFMITGVLGPHSNAHGPDEFLDIPTAKRLTCCVAQVLRDHHTRQ